MNYDTRENLRQASAVAHAASETGALRHAPAGSANQREAFERARRRIRTGNATELADAPDRPPSSVG